MSATVLTGKTIVNVVRVEITTEETTPKTYRFDTSEEVEADPVVSQGEEKIHRIKNKILGVSNTEDIVVGYNLKMKDNVLSPEILALIDGGTATFVTNEFTTYESPEAGAVVTRTAFALDIYTSEVDTDGSILGYYKFSFPHAKGEPVKYSFKDGDFFVPEFTAKSRPKKTEHACTITQMDTLPA